MTTHKVFKGAGLMPTGAHIVGFADPNREAWVFDIDSYKECIISSNHKIDGIEFYFSDHSFDLLYTETILEMIEVIEVTDEQYDFLVDQGLLSSNQLYSILDYINYLIIQGFLP